LEIRQQGIKQIHKPLWKWPTYQGIVRSQHQQSKDKAGSMGGTCVTAVGQFLVFVTEAGVDASGLGRWLWHYVGGGGVKRTRLITAYQPSNPGKKTWGETVWDQQRRYFESRGEVRNPRLMFKADLLGLLRRWKVAGDKVLLVGDFNKNVYSSNLAAQLAGNNLRMTKMCHPYTWPGTHRRSVCHMWPGVQINEIASQQGGHRGS
jgi:hypothetical protein